MATVKVLRTVRDDLTSYDNFPYPKWTEETGPVKVSCLDWDPNTECGNGLHGIIKENYKYPIYDQYNDDKIKWMVIEVDDNPDNFVKIDDKKVKFNEGYIIYQGNDVEKAIRIVFDDEESLNNLFKYDYTYKVFFAATVKDIIKINGDLIKYPLLSDLDFVDYDLCNLAVNKNGYAIEYILEHKPELVDYDLCQLSCSKNGNNIKYILEYKPELGDRKLSELALNNSGNSIYYILRNKPELVDYDLCQLAVTQNGCAISSILNIKPELVDYDLIKIAFENSHIAIREIFAYCNLLTPDVVKFSIDKINGVFNRLLTCRHDLISEDIIKIEITRNRFILGHLMRRFPQFVTDDLIDYHNKIWKS